MTCINTHLNKNCVFWDGDVDGKLCGEKIEKSEWNKPEDDEKCESFFLQFHILYSLPFHPTSSSYIWKKRIHIAMKYKHWKGKVCLQSLIVSMTIMSTIAGTKTKKNRETQKFLLRWNERIKKMKKHKMFLTVDIRFLGGCCHCLWGYHACILPTCARIYVSVSWRFRILYMLVTSPLETIEFNWHLHIFIWQFCWFFQIMCRKSLFTV